MPNRPAARWRDAAFEVVDDHPAIRRGDPHLEDVMVVLVSPPLPQRTRLYFRFTEWSFDGDLMLTALSGVFLEGPGKDARYGAFLEPAIPAEGLSVMRDLPLAYLSGRATRFLADRGRLEWAASGDPFARDLERVAELRRDRRRLGELVEIVRRLEVVARSRNPQAPVLELAQMLNVDPRQVRRWLTRARQASGGGGEK